MRYYHEVGEKEDEDYYDFYCSFPSDVVITRQHCDKMCTKSYCLDGTMRDLERKVEAERENRAAVS